MKILKILTLILIAAGLYGATYVSTLKPASSPGDTIKVVMNYADTTRRMLINRRVTGKDTTYMPALTACYWKHGYRVIQSGSAKDIYLDEQKHRVSAQTIVWQTQDIDTSSSEILP